MNALATVKQETPSCVPQLPASLAEVLERVRLERPAFADLPLLEPEDRKEVPAALEAVEATLVPATPDQIAAALATVSFALPSRMTDVDAEARLEVYIKALNDIPVDVLNDACMEAVKSCKFFPKVAELRQFAKPELVRRQWRKFLLEQLAEKHDRDWRPPVPACQLVKPEDLAKLRKRMERRFTSKHAATA